jgi:phage baseplate assembly protein W
MSQPFTSLHYPFAIDDAQGRIHQETDFDHHVRQLIMQVLMTAPGERVHRPDFGCGVKRLVFAPGGEISALLARSIIHQSLSKWLPNAITIQNVDVQAKDSTLLITIVYVVRASGERRYLNLEVTP